MPRRPLSPCTTPGCPNLVAKPGPCATHARGVDADVKSRSRSVRRYHGSWPRIRAAVLRDEPYCRACAERGVITLATEVDHIVPLADGGDHRRSNLAPLCAVDHRRKTARERRLGGDYSTR